MSAVMLEVRLAECVDGLRVLWRNVVPGRHLWLVGNEEIVEMSAI